MNDRVFRIVASSLAATASLWLGVGMVSGQSSEKSPAISAERLDPDVPIDSLERLSNMSAKELDELRRKKRQFDALSENDRKRIRDFHSELQSHAESTQLSAIMKRYYTWLKTLDLNDQISLLDLPVDQRLKRIKELRDDRARELFGKTGATKLPNQDAERVFRWIEKTIKSKREQVLAYFRSDVGSEKLEKYRSERGPTGRRGGRRGNRSQRRPGSNREGREDLPRMLELLIKVDPDFVAELIFEDIEDLRADLSQEAIQIFEEQETAEQKLLVLNWVTATIRAKQHISEQTLQQFYETLSPKQRENLDRRSPEVWHRTLRSWYLRQQDEQNQSPAAKSAGPNDPPSEKNEDGQPAKVNQHRSDAEQAGSPQISSG